MLKTMMYLLIFIHLFYTSESTKSPQTGFGVNHCGMHRIQIRIRYKNCVPVKVRARACNGACESYTKVSTTYPWDLEQSCNCCQYAGRKLKRFGMKCPDRTNKRKFKLVVMSVMLPRGCRCRPCSTIPNAVKAPERTMFNTSPIIGDMDIFKRDWHLHNFFSCVVSVVHSKIMCKFTRKGVAAELPPLLV